MAALTKTNKPVAVPRGFEIPGALIRHVLLDPGIVYSSADILLFSATNTLGLAATVAATGIAAGLRTCAVLQPRFLEKYPAVRRIAFDDRTPLRAGGLALLVVGGAALGGGAVLPATASMLFAVANFRLAESISITSGHHQVSPPPRLTKPSAAENVVTFLKRPEIYLNTGFACAGLMSGGGALFILPVVTLAFGMGLRNVLREQPEYAGHPKLLTAAAAALFAGIGYANGHHLIALAHAMNGAVLLEMERRVTPGGLWQIARDVKQGFSKLLGKKDLSTQKLAPEKLQPRQTVEQENSAPFRQVTYAFNILADKSSEERCHYRPIPGTQMPAQAQARVNFNPHG